MEFILKEELIEKLRAFSLSPNQAKIYAFLCEAGRANVSKISEATQIHPQDIYKAAVVLEDKGLVMRAKTGQLIIEAIPAERALQNLIKLIESNSRKEIETLRKYCKEIALENKKVPMNVALNKDYNSTFIVLEKQAPESRVDLAFDSLKEEYDCISVEGIVNYRKLEADYGKIQFKKISKRGVRIRLLILGHEISLARIEAMKHIMPKDNYELRTLIVKDVMPCSPFALIDSKELWLTIPSMGKEDAIILTDVKEVVEMARHQFEVLWNDPNTKIEAKGTSTGKKGARKLLQQTC